METLKFANDSKNVKDLKQSKDLKHLKNSKDPRDLEKWRDYNDFKALQRVKRVALDFITISEETNTR